MESWVVSKSRKARRAGFQKDNPKEPEVGTGMSATFNEIGIIKHMYPPLKYAQVRAG